MGMFFEPEDKGFGSVIEEILDKLYTLCGGYSKLKTINLFSPKKKRVINPFRRRSHR